MPYEVADADGRCLYRGDDLELACEIHDQLRTAHLRRLPVTGPPTLAAGRRTPHHRATDARRREPAAR